MKTKICTKCYKYKNLSNFSKNGTSCWCKQCVKEYNKDYNIKNKKRLKIQKQQFYQEHKEEIINKVQEYAKDHKKSIIIYQKQYKDKNKEKSKQYQKSYQNRRNQQRNKRYKIDINYKLIELLRGRLYKALKNNWKKGKTIELLACSIEELKKHLESKFTEGMNWKTHGRGKGKWNIDHIKPCSSFDLSKPEEQHKCFNFNNLQPLWAIDNLRKSDKILKDID